MIHPPAAMLQLPCHGCYHYLVKYCLSMMIVCTCTCGITTMELAEKKIKEAKFRIEQKAETLQAAEEKLNERKLPRSS